MPCDASRSEGGGRSGDAPPYRILVRCGAHRHGERSEREGSSRPGDGLTRRRPLGFAETRSPRRPRAQDSVVQHQVDPRPRRERRQPFQQFDGLEQEIRCPVRPMMPQIEPRLSLLRQVNAIVRRMEVESVLTA